MEIKINIKKKHLYYLTGLICLLLIGLVIATDYIEGEPFHQTLYTDTITGKGGTDVTVSDPLTVTGKLTAQGGLDVTGEAKIPGLAIKIGRYTRDGDGTESIGNWAYCSITGIAAGQKSSGRDWGEAKCIVGKYNNDGSITSVGTDTIIGESGLDWGMELQEDTAGGSQLVFYCEVICFKFVVE